MVGSESGREPLALRAFRHTGRVTLEGPQGETAEGRGIVAPVRRGKEEIGGLRHPLGTLGRPLYRFVGWLPEPGQAVGGVLSQGGERYKVLEAGPVLLGERQVCVRALLEKEDEA